eukprot:7216023-Pyramimonas_sp.AAC.1
MHLDGARQRAKITTHQDRSLGRSSRRALRWKNPDHGTQHSNSQIARAHMGTHAARSARCKETLANSNAQVPKRGQVRKAINSQHPSWGGRG